MKGIKIFIILFVLISFLFILQNTRDKQLIDKISEVTTKGILDIKATLFFLSVAVNIDPDVPKIYIDSPLNQTYTTTSIDLKYTIVDNSLDTTYYNIDDGTNITITGNISFTTTLGSHTLKLFANDTLGRLNSSSVTFAVIQSAAGGGTGGGGGGGGGGGKAVKKILEELPIELDKDLIKVSLLQGETKRELIKIKNIGDKIIDLEINLDKIQDFLIFPGGVSEYNLKLNPGEERSLQLIFNVNEDYKPGIYIGDIVIAGNNLKKKIPTIIEVESKKKIFDISLNIKNKELYPGQYLIFDVMLFNLGEDKNRVDTQVELGIKDLDGNIINKKDARIAVETQASFTEEILAPSYLKANKYVLYAIVQFDGEIGTATEIFEVKSKEFIPGQYSILILVILILIIIAVIEYLRYKKIKTKKKRSNR